MTGDVAVAHLTKDKADEILDMWGQDDAVEIRKDLTPLVLCKIATVLQGNAE